MFTPEEADEYMKIGTLNGLFVLGRSIGFIGHHLDQKRLQVLFPLICVHFTRFWLTEVFYCVQEAAVVPPPGRRRKLHRARLALSRTLG